MWVRFYLLQVHELRAAMKDLGTDLTLPVSVVCVWREGAGEGKREGTHFNNNIIVWVRPVIFSTWIFWRMLRANNLLEIWPIELSPSPNKKYAGPQQSYRSNWKNNRMWICKRSHMFFCRVFVAQRQCHSGFGRCFYTVVRTNWLNRVAGAVARIKKEIEHWITQASTWLIGFIYLYL